MKKKRTFEDTQKSGNYKYVFQTGTINAVKRQVNFEFFLI